jgi:hypothetical protein
MKLFQSYVLFVSNLFRPFFLLVANFYFKKNYPQVDLSSFSTVRLSRMCAIRGQFPNLDIPLLSDEDLDRLYFETNIMYAKDTAKAAWWVAKISAKLPIKAVQISATGLKKGSATFDNLTVPLKSISGSSSSNDNAKPYESGLAMSAAVRIETLESDIKNYQEKYDFALKIGGVQGHADADIYSSLLKDRRKELSHLRETYEFQQKQDSLTDERLRIAKESKRP